MPTNQIRRHPSAELCMRAAIESCHCNRERFFGPTRERVLVEVRDVAVRLMTANTLLNLGEMAEAMDKDRSTIETACERITRRIESNENDWMLDVVRAQKRLEVLMEWEARQPKQETTPCSS
jgi:chromosomal replication initiation ATPase DnaA